MNFGKGWLLAAAWLILLTSGGAGAQVATTTVQDTVYRADGTAAGGSVVVSWNAFTTASGQAVPAGTTSAVIGASGVLTMALAPNAGSTPMGSYYTAVFHLNDGTTSREYWVVPAVVPGGGAAKLGAIRNQVLPSSVAMQTVSKAYVDMAVARAAAGTTAGADTPYVLKTGDTMTGPLVLPGDPVSTNQAADKHYVDAGIAGVASGLGQKVSTLPAATQTVSQPTGTQLEVNNLNGDLYASQYVSGAGNNGILNALNSADCGAGCSVKVESNYASNEVARAVNVPTEGQLVDTRGGVEGHVAVNPLGVGGSANVAFGVDEVQTMSAPQLQAVRPGAIGIGSSALSLTSEALAGGSNQFPEQVEQPPYFKNSYGVLSMSGTYYTAGQHVQAINSVHCYGVGDCLAGSQQITSSGGYRDSADEGAHPFDLLVTEDPIVYTGVCASGCTRGSTSVMITPSGGSGTQGEGRFLIDKNPAGVLTTGSLVGGSRTLHGTATFSGTNFPASVFLRTAQAALSQPNDIAPGAVTLAITTSGVPAGFATNTAALPASSGVACLTDLDIPNFEMANYTVVDGTHLRLTLNKVHNVNTTVSVGGLCGYGLEQTVDTTRGLRQLFPVIGSLDATNLYYVDAATTIVGQSGGGSTSGFLNLNAAIATIARAGNVVTLTTAGNIPNVNGLTLRISGVADASYNGTFAVTTTGTNSLTYANTGADSTSTGGTISYLTGGYALYPMAEVLSVYDPANKQVDGLMTLGANTVAWAAGDAVEEPHFYQQQVAADTELITQYVPRPVHYQSAGKAFDGLAGPGLTGWQISNNVAPSNYLSGGGTHTAPDNAFGVSGAWSNDFNVEAGLNAVMRIQCNFHGCSRWDSEYHVLDLQNQYGEDFVNYFPNQDALEMMVGGTSYVFAPGAFTASRINVGTLNATHVQGSVDAGSITTGTIDAARLPVFGPSGTTHAPGIVPDPGPTAGVSRFLREDGTFAIPPNSGGGSGFWTLNPATNDIYSNNASNEVGVGTTTPGQWSAVNVTGNGSNVQIASQVVARLIVAGPNAEFHFVSTTAPSGQRNWRLFADPSGNFTMAMNSDNYSSSTTSYQCAASGRCTFPNGLTASAFHETLTTPASSSAACSAGDFTDDANFHYVCVSANTWRRVALTSF